MHDDDSTSAGPPPVVASFGALLLLMSLTALGQMATNLVVPSLAVIVAELGLLPTSGGLILSAVLIGIGVGQLVVGPLSDSWGRRPVLLAGLALYVLAGIAATFATSGPMLLVARLMQGLGASAGLALPRAIARDRYTGATFLRVMSSLTLAMAVMPGIAPVLGGLVAGHSGWRASLALSALTGVAVLVAVVLALPESHLNRVRGSGMAAALAGYAHVMRKRVFLGYAFASGAAVGGAYAEVAGVQRLYEGTFGWSPMAVSFVSGTYAFAFLVGGLLAPRLRLSHHRTIQLGVGLIVASALIFLGLTASGTITAPLAMAAMMLSQIGVGCMMPPAIGLGLMAVEGAAGTASAVMGAIHMLAGATGAALIGALAMPIVWAMPLIMLGFAVIAVLATLAAQPRQRDGRPALA